MQKAANRALKEPRSVATLRLRMALDAKQRAERAQRIKQLREESPYTQAAIADRVGVTPRAYQRWEEGGGIEWEHLERLAEIHDAEVLWIHRGEGRGPTPDLVEELSGDDRFSRLEEQLAELRADVAELGVELARGTDQERTWRKKARGAGS
jgi:transcriptional regulator with XRE-family HTH domain